MEGLNNNNNSDDGVPLSVEALSLYKTASENQRRAEEQIKKNQAEIAGAHPFIVSKEARDEAVEYLKSRLLDAAKRGYDQAVVGFLDVPGIQRRWDRVHPLWLVRDADLRSGVNAMIEAFKEKHPDMKDRIAIHLTHSIRIWI